MTLKINTGKSKNEVPEELHVSQEQKLQEKKDEDSSMSPSQRRGVRRARGSSDSDQGAKVFRKARQGPERENK